MTLSNNNETMRGSTRFLLALALEAALYALFQPVLSGTAGGFLNPFYDLMHGWLVAPFALVAVIASQGRLRGAAGRPAWGGVAALLGFAALSIWIGQRGGQGRICQVAMCCSIPAMVWAAWGRKAARWMIFPAGFMLFVLPMNFLDGITFPLRQVSTQLAALALNGVGIKVQAVGSSLISKGFFSLDVADPCSGIRSIFAIMALCAAIGFLKNRSRLQITVLIACGIPLAVLGNIARLVSIGLVARYFGQETAMSMFHEISGFFTFPVAILLIMLFEERLIPKIGKKQPKASYEWWESWHSAGIGILFYCLVIVRLVTSGIMWDLAEKYPRAGELLVTHDLTGWLTLLIVGGFMWRRERATLRKAETPRPAVPFTRKDAVVMLLAIAVALGMAWFSRHLPEPKLDTSDFIAESLPDTMGNLPGEQFWYCHRQSCLAMMPDSEAARAGENNTVRTCPGCGDPLREISYGEESVLPADTRLMKRIYHNESQAWTVTVVLSGASRQSIHRPDLCLSGQGYVINKKIPRTFTLDNGQKLNIMIYKVRKDGVESIGFVNFLATEKYQTASHFKRICYDIWQRSFRARVNRWAMFTFVCAGPADSPENLEALRQMLSDWLPQVYLRDLPTAE